MYRNRFGETFTNNKVYTKDIRYAIIEGDIAETFEYDFNTRLDELEDKGYIIVNSDVMVFDTKYVGTIEYCYKDYLYIERGEINGEQQVQDISGASKSFEGTEGEEERGD